MNGAGWFLARSCLLLGLVAACGSEQGSAAERLPDSGSGYGGSVASGGSGGGGLADGAAGSSGSAGETGAGAGGCNSVPSVQALSFGTDWNNFDDTTFVHGGVYQDSRGEVHLQGVVSKLGGTPAQGDVIATLPENLSPGERMVFAAHVKGYGRVDVTTAGNVLWMSGVASEQDYTSLAGISFRPGPTSEGWTEAVLATWEDYGGSYGPAAYRKDSTHEVHLRGLVKQTAAPSGATILTLPEGHRPAHRLIFLVASSSNTPGRVDVVPDGRVLWYPGNSGYVTLSGLSFHVEPATFESGALAGTWAAYGGTHAPAGYYKDCGGRVHLRGLITESAGEPKPGLILTLPEGYRPSGHLMFPVATRAGSSSGPAAGRVDVHSDGRVVRVSGGTFETDWTSLTGISFASAAP
jgi:hypothetical protein